MMNNKIISTGAFFGLTAIILGAFGAHALKKILTIDQLTSFDTGVKYQMYHALFLLFLGIENKLQHKTKKIIYILTVVGILLFSFSIYLLTTSPISSLNFKSIGFLTPIGGLLLIMAWSVLGYGYLKKKT
jgi:uncharacterized membrane protein YgdD (TMEM256/DUF423 family)